MKTYRNKHHDVLTVTYLPDGALAFRHGSRLIPWTLAADLIREGYRYVRSAS